MVGKRAGARQRLAPRTGGAGTEFVQMEDRIATLQVERGSERRRTVEVRRARFYIGRLPSSDLFLEDCSVSRKHAKITRTQGGTFLIEDLDSTNGLIVNGAKCHRSALRDGDLVVLGDYRLTFAVSGVDHPASDTDNALVRVDKVWKEYALGKQTVSALRDVSLEVRRGEFLALAGPSGSGKSTLLNLIGCIDTPTRGDIYIENQNVSSRSPDQLADLRAQTLGFVFQTFNLLPVLTAWENIEYPLLQNKDLSREKRGQRVERYLDVVGLSKFKRHRPNELSGGQRQRVAIARALATRPSVVLADEPTANLDHATGEGILRLMREINREEDTTFVFSTHDPRVMEMADRLVGLSDGQISE